MSAPRTIQTAIILYLGYLLATASGSYSSSCCSGDFFFSGIFSQQEILDLSYSSQSPRPWAKPCTFAIIFSPFLLEPGPIQPSLTWSHGGSFWDTHQFSGFPTFNSKLKPSGEVFHINSYLSFSYTPRHSVLRGPGAVAISTRCSHRTESPSLSSNFT